MALKAVSDRLGSFFSVSPYQGIVDEATSEFLLSPDWDKNIAIVDCANEREENAKVCSLHIYFPCSSNFHATFLHIP